ncbi:SCO family protein [Methylobacter sp. YRD-M1]|uniref:SCO family protein n=1 Tax=Methylobacter sp. YRD-M1 TaxID=2911520 RepID=UPI00227A68D8|nr:SCO family protein [Methylobacter sp. YRD-M1]WAK00869.1 SCO family protein [Methylobacter sp. YRD-M1]
MNIKFRTEVIITLLITGVLIAVVPDPAPKAIASPVALPNAELKDQNGTPVRFASDVAGNRIMALNFIYTDCQTACPVVSGIFSKLQSRLGDKLAQDVRMVSLSINPAADTPERLKAYAERFHAAPEWLWLTGEKAQVDTLLKSLGVYSTDVANHAPVILVGDPVRGEWTRFNGLSSPNTIAARIDELLNARHGKS